MSLVPTKANLTCGVGRPVHELVAFELALRDAGVAAQNLVTVSSILPPSCPLVTRLQQGLALLCLDAAGLPVQREFDGHARVSWVSVQSEGASYRVGGDRAVSARAQAMANLGKISHHAQVLEVSSRTGKGMSAWLNLLSQESAVIRNG